MICIIFYTLLYFSIVKVISFKIYVTARYGKKTIVYFVPEMKL